MRDQDSRRRMPRLQPVIQQWVVAAEPRQACGSGMRHTIPWSVKGVDQDAREAAKEAARRAGMSLGEWLNTAIAEQAETATLQETDTGLSTVTRRLDTIAQRLDAVARRDQGAATVPAILARTEHGDLVRALDAVARLAEISERRSAAAIEAVERLGAQSPPRHAAPVLSPERSEAHARLDEIARSIRDLDSPAAARAAPAPRVQAPARARAFHHDIDATVAEIAARQRQLETGLAGPAPTPPPAAAPQAPAAPMAAADRDLGPIAAKLDALGRQLDEVLRQPAQRQQPVVDRAAIAGEISKLSARIDAVAKPQDDGLERELKALSGRIEQMRKDMAARETSQGESAIAEIRADIAALSEQLTDLAPRRVVESLEAEIHAIADRLDQAREQGVSDAPLQSLVAEFERTVSRLMPAEGIAEEIRALSYRVDTLAAKGLDTSLIERLTDETSAIRAMLADAVKHDAVEALAAQIAALGQRVEEIAAPRPDSGAEALASAIEARIDEIATRLESASRASVPAAAPATSPELEDALRKLADKLDASHSRGSDPLALAEIERHILTLAGKIDASDARFAQLGMIERGLSDLFVQMEEMRASAIDAAERAARNAVLRDGEMRRDAVDPAGRRPQESVEAVQNTLERVVKRIAEIEAPASAPDLSPAAPMVQAAQPAEARRAPALAPVVAERPAAPVSRQSAPSRPPGSVDLPLEPGSGAPRLRPPAPGAAAPGGRTDFIAAARRAAQAAAADPVRRNEAPEAEKPSLLSKLRGAMRKAPSEPAAAVAEAPEVRPARRRQDAAAAPLVRDAAPEVLIEPSVEAPRPADDADGDAKPRFSANRKTIVMAIAAALLVLAAGLSTLPRLRGTPPTDDTTRSITVAPQGRSEASPATTAADQPRSVPTTTFTPAATASTPVDLTPPTPTTATETPAPPASTPETAPETTGSVQRAAPTGTTVSPTGWQPVDTRTGRALSIPQPLRTAAEAGDPAAAFELGSRYLEGRGVAVSAAEAAKWYQRAADAGIAPAQYRLGSLYEKGSGVLRDFERARRLYERAAETGNGKAMHNLAVMFAQGQASERPDYRTAAQWFRKAAEHGVTDSQYNLGILYARGLGVDQSLAESYKWFSLAATGGDQDAGKKRDEVAGRLDAQTLVAARLAVQTFAVKPEPEAAIRVAAPAGGWGDPPVAAAPATTSAPAQPVRPAARRVQSQSR
jgi:localization factor PodJL